MPTEVYMPGTLSNQRTSRLKSSSMRTPSALNSTTIDDDPQEEEQVGSYDYLFVARWNVLLARFDWSLYIKYGPHFKGENRAVVMCEAQLWLNSDLDAIDILCEISLVGFQTAPQSLLSGEVSHGGAATCLTGGSVHMWRICRVYARNVIPSELPSLP